MIVIKKSEAAWSEQRKVWRIDIQYDLAGATKRTFINIPDCPKSKTGGSSQAKLAAKEFRRSIGEIYESFWSKVTATAPPVRDAAPRPVIAKVIRETEPTIGWLLDQCMTHPEIWGRVKHSKNYISTNKKLCQMIGSRRCVEFEAPHGRKIVIEVLGVLRAEKFSDGYIRKVMYQLRQALGALIGAGITEPITHPQTGELLISDIPTWPSLPKSPSRTAVLEIDHDKIVFDIIKERTLKAKREEVAYREKIGGGPATLGIKPLGNVEIDGETTWLNPRRYSSSNWQSFGHYITFLLETGCRRSEALSVGNHSLRTREVTGDDGEVLETFQVIHLPADVTKSGQPRDINMSPAVQSGSKFWHGVFGKPLSFKIGDRTITVPKAWFPILPNQVTGMWNLVRSDAMERGCDLSKISPHQLRHSHATRMSARGLSGKALSDTLGHTDERTTRIYDHAQQVHNSRKFFSRSVSRA